jgi:hypothetical protein
MFVLRSIPKNLELCVSVQMSAPASARLGNVTCKLPRGNHNNACNLDTSIDHSINISIESPTLTAFQDLSHYPPDPISTCPCPFLLSSAQLREYQAQASKVPSSVSCRDLWPAVTLNVFAQGDFGGQPALERNRIFELRGTKPDYLMEF